MKKLKLDLDRIQVSSFVVEAPESGGGTVRAFAAPTEDYDCSLFPYDCPDMLATRMDPCHQG